LKNVRLPVVELPDGRRLFAPTLREVAASHGFFALVFACFCRLTGKPLFFATRRALGFADLKVSDDC
jgi:hypothetical protein